MVMIKLCQGKLSPLDGVSLANCPKRLLNLAHQCCSREATERPTLGSVALDLQGPTLTLLDPHVLEARRPSEPLHGWRGTVQAAQPSLVSAISSTIAKEISNDECAEASSASPAEAGDSAPGLLAARFSGACLMAAPKASSPSQALANRSSESLEDRKTRHDDEMAQLREAEREMGSHLHASKDRPRREQSESRRSKQEAFVPQVGDRVKHIKRGEGLVAEFLPDGRARIVFDSGEEHRYNPSSYPKLSKVKAGALAASSSSLGSIEEASADKQPQMPPQPQQQASGITAPPAAACAPRAAGLQNVTHRPVSRASARPSTAARV